VPCKFTELVIDAADPRQLAQWWSEVLGYQVLGANDNEVEIGCAMGAQPTLLFVRVPEAKRIKNRLHIDVNPSGESTQEAELRRLLDLGAKQIDIGQGDVSWHVLADPEGNEFCLLKSTVQ
jgi:hypothetical protein